MFISEASASSASIADFPVGLKSETESKYRRLSSRPEAWERAASIADFLVGSSPNSSGKFRRLSSRLRSLENKPTRSSVIQILVVKLVIHFQSARSPRPSRSTADFLVGSSPNSSGKYRRLSSRLRSLENKPGRSSAIQISVAKLVHDTGQKLGDTFPVGSEYRTEQRYRQLSSRPEVQDRATSMADFLVGSAVWKTSRPEAR